MEIEGTLIGPFHCLWRYRDLFVQMTKRALSERYKGSALGLVWLFVEPLMMLAVYTFVFTYVLKARLVSPALEGRTGAFAVVMLCGMAVMNIFSTCLSVSCHCVEGKRNFVKKVIFPLEILPMVEVMAAHIFGLAWFGLLVGSAGLLLHSLSWWSLLLPIYFLPLLFFSAGFSMFTASISVYLRDFPQFVNVFLRILYFMTPIFYSADSVPPKYSCFFWFNPLTWIIEEARKVLFYGQMPSFKAYAILTLISLVVFYLGFAWFRKTKKGFADVI